MIADKKTLSNKFKSRNCNHLHKTFLSKMVTASILPFRRHSKMKRSVQLLVLVIVIIIFVIFVVTINRFTNSSNVQHHHRVYFKQINSPRYPHNVNIYKLVVLSKKRVSIDFISQGNSLQLAPSRDGIKSFLPVKNSSITIDYSYFSFFDGIWKNEIILRAHPDGSILVEPLQQQMNNTEKLASPFDTDQEAQSFNWKLAATRLFQRQETKFELGRTSASRVTTSILEARTEAQQIILMLGISELD